MVTVSDTLAYAVSRQAKPKGGEDKFSAQVLENGVFYAGLFDGHNGHTAADMCAEYMPKLLNQEYRKNQPGISVLKNAFLSSDKLVTDDSGSTATVLLIHKHYLVCAHVGDTRAVLCHNGRAVTINEDHHVDWDPERERISQVEQETNQTLIAGERVQNLMLTRSIGDHGLSDVIIAYPVVNEILISKDDEYLILATDGFWDVYSGAEAVTYIKAHERLEEQEIADMLVFLAVNRYREREKKLDDITCAVFRLQKKRVDECDADCTTQEWSFDAIIDGDTRNQGWN